MHHYYEIADKTRRTDGQPLTEKRTNSPTGTATTTYYFATTYTLDVVSTCVHLERIFVSRLPTRGSGSITEGNTTKTLKRKNVVVLTICGLASAS